MRDTARGDSQCAIPRVVHHSARYHAWCLTVYDTARGDSQCVIPRVVTHSARYRVWCDVAMCPSHTARYNGLSVTHCQVISLTITYCAMSRCVRHTPRDITVCPSHTAGLSRCIRHTPRDIAVRHTPRDISGSASHRVLSRSPPHTARYHVSQKSSKCNSPVRK